jgi:ferrous iron transport protein B
MTVIPKAPQHEAVSTTRLIAIAGNPNAGKTTLFNRLTGARQRVGNYPGVTVERKSGHMTLPSGEQVELVDLPGCYSIAARSPEEQIAHDVLLGESTDTRRPDTVVAVIDASNVRRNLYLATQIRDLDTHLIVALNMMDVAKKRGYEIDCSKLSAALGCPVIPIVARTGEGMQELLAAMDRPANGKRACGKGTSLHREAAGRT